MRGNQHVKSADGRAAFREDAADSSELGSRILVERNDLHCGRERVD